MQENGEVIIFGAGDLEVEKGSLYNGWKRINNRMRVGSGRGVCVFGVMCFSEFLLFQQRNVVRF